MKWNKLLKDEFKDEIQDVKIINENEMIILEVKVKYNDIDSVDEITKRINKFIDDLEIELDFDSLSITSPGVELHYKTDELGKLIGELLDIKLIKHVNKHNFYSGELLENNEENILIKWNCKGQFRKQLINKKLIKSIEKHIKF